jgi:hypothetical protein
MTPSIVLALFSALAAEGLLHRSIAYHDPDGRWERGAFEITDVSSRVDGTGRRTVLRFDNARGRFEMEQVVDGRVLKIVVENDAVVEVRLDGRAELSAEEIDRFRLSPAQVLTTRNFYLYLYGLPMKLKDPPAPDSHRTRKRRYFKEDLPTSFASPMTRASGATPGTSTWIAKRSLSSAIVSTTTSRRATASTPC